MRNKTLYKAFFFLICFFSANATYATPGDLDLSFGNGGFVVTSFTNAPYDDLAYSMQVQPDGKILVGGVVYWLEPENDDYVPVSFFLARYIPNGTLDASFGTNGTVIAPISQVASSYVGYDIALQPDGKIVSVGRGWLGNANGFAVHRYNANGTLDDSFAAGGVVVTPFENHSVYATSVAVQPDGKIVVAGEGRAFANSSPVFATGRYNPDGSLDASFGVGGKVITGLGGFGAPTLGALAVQPNGKILVVGGSSSRHTLIRYNADGSPDLGFGSNGIVLGSFDGVLYDAALQPDGKIVVSGGPNLTIRYNSNGSLDTGFGQGGFFGTDPGAIRATSAVSLQSNGKLIAFGRTFLQQQGHPNFALVRLNTNGTPDTGFGNTGIVTTPFGMDQTGVAVDGAVQPDGKILAFGTTSFRDGNPKNIAIVRYLGDSAVSVSGRVTKPGGQGLSNATVSITGPMGFSQTATTSTFGFYSFDNILAGATYTISVPSRRYRFAPLSVEVNSNLTDIDLIGLE